MREKNLVILAAGIGSRFKGGIKQLQSVGPAGECIMEYSVYDAVNAGFNRVVFIIRHDIEAFFEEAVGGRIRSFCEKRGVEVVCAYQEIDKLPEGFTYQNNRQKPWGTCHALLCCKGLLSGGFTVINADDYYGPAAFRKMSAFLDTQEGCGVYAMAGFLLGNTLSDNGGVTRGLCRTDRDGWLTQIDETRNIVKTQDGAAVEEETGMRALDVQMPVSMNMWAFTPDVLDRLEERFCAFLRSGGLETGTGECLLPIEIGNMIREGSIRVSVIATPGQWFGMTYSADIPLVQAALAQKHAENIYPTPLFL